MSAVTTKTFLKEISLVENSLVENGIQSINERKSVYLYFHFSGVHVLGPLIFLQERNEVFFPVKDQLLSSGLRDASYIVAVFNWSYRTLSEII